MIKLEFKRLIFSKKTVLILSVLTLIYLVSCFFVYQEIREFSNLLSTNSLDINIDVVEKSLQESKGFHYFSQFIFNSELFHVYIFTFFLFIGIFLSNESIKRKQSGFGNLIQIRQRYGLNLKNIIISQSLYIISLIFLSFLINLLIGYALSGFKLGLLIIGKHEFSEFVGLMILFLQFIIICTVSIFINIICHTIFVYINSSRIIESLPFLIFGIGPVILGSTIGNLNRYISYIFNVLIPFNTIYVIRTYLNGNELNFAIIYVILLIFVTTILYRANIQKYSEDYI